MAAKSDNTVFSIDNLLKKIGIEILVYFCFGIVSLCFVMTFLFLKNKIFVWLFFGFTIYCYCMLFKKKHDLLKINQMLKKDITHLISILRRQNADK